MAKKRYRPWNPDQMVLFPPTMKDSLDEGHIVFRIMDVVETLDIRCINQSINANASSARQKRKRIACLS